MQNRRFIGTLGSGRLIVTSASQPVTSPSPPPTGGDLLTDEDGNLLTDQDGNLLTDGNS